MKRILLTFLVGLFSTLTALQVQAQTEPQKIGTVDVEYILMNLPEFKQLESNMQTYRKQLTSQLDSKTAELQRKSDEYQRGVESGMLLPSIRADKEKELYSMQQSIQEFESSAQEDLQSKYQSEMDPINVKVQASIDKIAATNNYTYIISTQLYSGEKIIVYSKANTNNDISLLVLKDLGVIIPPAGSTTTTVPTTPTNTTTPTTPAVKMAPVKK